jgi:hypothetical protein
VGGVHPNSLGQAVVELEERHEVEVEDCLVFKRVRDFDRRRRLLSPPSYPQNDTAGEYQSPLEILP